MLNSPDLQIRLLHKMVELYSPTGQETEMTQLLFEEMHAIGFHSRIDEVGNAIGEYGDGDPTILLCGHMDTVPGRLPVKMHEGKLYGRGAVDAKSALAAIICAASSLVIENFPGKLIVIGAVDEEGKGRGVKNLVEKDIRADYAIFGEPSGVDNITIAYKGSCHVRITCITKTGHSSAPWLFHNAIEEAFHLWTKLQNIHFQEERTESKFYSVTSALTQIRGGGSSSTVPSFCELHADFRFPPAISLKKFLEEVTKATEAHRTCHPDVKLEVEVEDSCEPYEAGRNSILVKGLAWAVNEVKGKRATLLRKTGTGDMNVLGAKLGVPMVTYGPGNSKLDHTEDECMDLNEYLDSIKILQKGLARTLDLHNKLNKK